MVNYAIVVEGKSDKEFIELLVKHITKQNIKNIQFYIMRGKSDFFNKSHVKYKELLYELNVTEEIEKALFILDADSIESDEKYGNYTNTQQEISNILEEVNITEKSDVYISCDPKTKAGYLESLILTTIPIEHKACVETFLKCSDFKSKDNAKAILNQIYRQAYPNAPYDFSHENFDELKSKLIALFTKE